MKKLIFLIILFMLGFTSAIQILNENTYINDTGSYIWSSSPLAVRNSTGDLLLCGEALSYEKYRNGITFKIADKQFNFTYEYEFNESVNTTEQNYYYCKDEVKYSYCPEGLSGGLGTRCYLSEILGVPTWDYCSTGWESTTQTELYISEIGLEPEISGCSFYFVQNFTNTTINVSKLKYSFDNYTFDGETIKSNGLTLDLKPAKEIQNINVTTENGSIVFTGENITKLDPTVGLVDGNSIIDGWKYNFCNGDSWDEDVSGFTLEAGAEGTGSCYEAWRSFLEFNLSDIPDSATSIDEIILQLRTVSNSAGRTIYIRNITGNYRPSQDYLTDSAFWTALENGASFGTFDGGNYGIQNHTLNSDAESYLLDSLSRDWFAVSIHNPSSESAESNTITFNTNEAITQSYKPVLYVTYTGGGDTDAPTWSNPSNTSDNFWKGENFTANVSMADENSVDVYIFSTNASGSWTNYTTDITGTTYDATETKELEVAGNVCWYYWFNDTSNNINSTDTFCFESFNPPRIDLNFYSPLNNSQINKTEFNPIKFNVTCKDNNCGEINLTAYYKVDDYVNTQDITKDETSYSGTCSFPTEAYDEDYDTEALSSTTLESCKISMNTTKPNYIDNALLDFKYEQNGATTRVSCWNYTSGSFYDFSLESSGTVRENKTIPFGCLNGDKLRLEVELTEGASSSSRFYEHSIWWNYPEYKEIPLDSSFLFTNTTNPFQVSLNEDEFSEITFWVNTTADEFTNYTFLGIANMTTYTSINNRSDEVNVIVNYNDFLPPTWTVIPNNESINYTEYWAGVTFEATDDGTIDDYYINWSDTFSITGGLLQNSTPLSAGSYRINVTVNDTSGNLNSTLYNLEVNKSESSCNVYINETSPIFTLSAFRVWTDCDSAFNLYRNGSIIANNSEQQLNDGQYNFSVVRTDQLNYTNIYDEETIIVSGDTIFPLFTNYENNNNTFNDSGTAYFNVTIEFTNGTAGISFDGINYSATNESNVFNVTIPIDFSGTYEYYWWSFGNGSQDNYNQSDVFIFYVGASERTVKHRFAFNYTNPIYIIKTWSDLTTEFFGAIQLFKTNTLGDCDLDAEGKVLYYSNKHKPCYCNSTDWVDYNGILCN